MTGPGPHDRRLDEFLLHWRSVPRRGDAVVPHLSDYLDRLNPQIQPWTIIVDVLPDALPIRLCGVKLADALGRDFTGADYSHAVRPDVRRHVIARDQHCVRRPCGVRMTMKLRAASGRVFEDHMLILPAQRMARTPADTAMSLIRVSSLGEDLGWQDSGMIVIGYLGAAWVDIGAGVPTAPPWADTSYTG